VLVTDQEAKKLSAGRYADFVGVGLQGDPAYNRWAVIDVPIALQSMVLATEV
jgi:hypothetical protein